MGEETDGDAETEGATATDDARAADDARVARDADAGRAAATVALVSDTHGRLRPAALDLCRGADLVLHAGDVGDPRVLTDLATAAPVRAVWGNMDGREVRRETTEDLEVTVAGVRIAVAHGHRVRDYDDLLDRYPEARVVVHGHSHEPKEDRRPGGRMVVNPGSAGPRRPGKPVTAARLEIGPDGELELEIRDLERGGPWRGDG